MLNLSNISTRIEDVSNMVHGPRSDTIEFVCAEEDYDVIPEPIPANKVLPEWYRNLVPRLGDGGLGSSSVKRCMPFMDAMTMGWIIPLAGEVQIESSEDGDHVKYEWRFHKDLMSSHHADQIGGDENPMAPMPVVKFHNYWALKVPDGYSALITAPMNRYEPRFQVFSGVVDCDQYFNYINFPSIWTQPDYFGVLDAGTPIVQVIPFKRDSIIGDGTVRQMTDDEELELQRTSDKLGSHESLYRDALWQPKNASRKIRSEPEESSGCPFHRG